MDQQPTALIRKCLILSYIVKWIQTESPELGKSSIGFLLAQIVAHARLEVLGEIRYLKQILRRNGIYILERRSFPEHIWVKYKHNQMIYEESFPKTQLVPDMEWQMETILRTHLKSEDCKQVEFPVTPIQSVP